MIGSRSVIRCAIYTRTPDGTSRDARARQRASCHAYIKRHQHAGWIALPDQYNDRADAHTGKGFSALQRLLMRVESGQVDRVVVERLSCICASATDLDRLLLILDHGRSSLVLAGQDINGATPVGRQVLVTLVAMAEVIDKPEATHDRKLAAQERAMAAIMRLRKVQSLHQIATKTSP